MTEMEPTSDETNSHELRDRLAKLLIGSAVGFIATALAENGYDSFVNWRRSRHVNVETAE